MLVPRFCLLWPEHPADPLITGKRGEVFPRRQNLWAGSQDTSQVRRDGMDHAGGDRPGTHRSPIVAPIRAKAGFCTLVARNSSQVRLPMARSGARLAPALIAAAAAPGILTLNMGLCLPVATM